jgi:hypothetical protein
LATRPREGNYFVNNYKCYKLQGEIDFFSWSFHVIVGTFNEEKPFLAKPFYGEL